MGIDNKQSYSLFTAGRAAMMLEGDWLVSQLNGSGANLDDYGIFPFPTNTERLYGFAEYNYISTKSKNPDIAAKFLDYFLSTKVQQDLLGQLSSTSVNKNVQYANQKPLEAEWLGIFQKYGKVYMIAGLEDITAGQISIDGRVVNNLQPKDRDIAMVFQNYALYPQMTVSQNMSASYVPTTPSRWFFVQDCQPSCEIILISSWNSLSTTDSRTSSSVSSTPAFGWARRLHATCR